MKATAKHAIRETAANDSITVAEMAGICGRTAKSIYDLANAGIIPKPVKGLLPFRESVRLFVASISHTKSHRARMDELKRAKLNLEIDKLARERKKDEKEWIEASLWLDKLSVHIGIIRQEIKAALLTEIPATMSGRSETEMRAMCEKVYHSLCRRIQNQSENLDPRDEPQYSERSQSHFPVGKCLLI